MVGDHRQVGHPGTDFFPILFGHHSRDLCNVPEIVNDPGGQQLSQGHRAQAGMCARQVQVLFSQVPGAKQFEVRSPKLAEFLQEGSQGALRISASMPKPIVGLEGRIRSRERG